MKRFILISALSLTAVGCSWVGGGQDKEYNDLVMRAENEIKLAAKTGFLWSNTEKFLTESKEAKAAGDMDKAMKLAKKALDEATLAQQQAKANANVHADFHLR